MKIKRNLKWALPLALIMALAIVGVVLAATVVIDEFVSGTDQSITITVPNNGSGSPDLPQTETLIVQDPAILGGERDLQLTVNAGNISDAAQWLVVTSPGTNYLSLAEAPNIEVLALAQYDGMDNSLALDCSNGFDSVDGDFTGGGTNDGISVRFVFSNSHPDMTLRLYTDCSNWKAFTIETPRGVTTGDVVDVFVPFSSFVGGAGTLDPSSINAFELEVDTTGHPGSDMQFKFLRADSVREFGDLPVSYGSASHIPNGLRLGRDIDAESTAQSSPDAQGDNILDIDDEDGVIRRTGVGNPAHGGWTNGTVASGNGGSMDIEINGGSGYPQVFIDWGSGLSEVTLRSNTGTALSMPLATGTHQVYFDVPDNTFDGVTDNIPLPIRVRLSTSGGLTATGPATVVQGGEVEDYIWGFGPTAVTLTALKADNNTSLIFVTAGILLLLVSSGAILVYKRLRA